MSARIRLAVGQPQRDPGARRGTRVLRAGGRDLLAQRRRGGRVDLADGVVELPDAGEPGGEGDVRGGQRRGLQQHPGRVRALRPGQCERSGTERGDQVPLHLPLAVAESAGQPADALAVDHPVVDQAHRPPDDIRAHVPLGRARDRVRPTAPAGPEAGCLRGRRRGVEPRVLPLRRGGRAARPAVDPGAGHGREEHPVEAGVAAAHRLVAVLVRQRCGGSHASIIRPPTDRI